MSVPMESDYIGCEIISYEEVVVGDVIITNNNPRRVVAKHERLGDHSSYVTLGLDMEHRKTPVELVFFKNTRTIRIS